MPTSPQLIRALRELLDRLIRSRKLANDDQEIIGDEVAAATRKLTNDGFLEALDAAVGKNKSRRRESVFLLAEFTHVPAVVDRIAQEFRSPDSNCRYFLAQVVRVKRLKQLAPHLNPIIASDPDVECKLSAIAAAGELRSACNLPTLLKLAECPPKGVVWNLTFALVRYAAPAARGYFERLFQDPSSEKQLRVIAAWGLAKHGDKASLRYLENMLFDPDIQTSHSYSPGESLRAAQAICDVKGWEFKWNKSFVLEHRDQWKKLLEEGSAN